MKQHHARATIVDRANITKNNRSLLNSACRVTVLPAGMAVTTWALLSALLATPCHALPQNPAVVAGSATITQSNATTMTVNQSSGNAIINWNGYNIGANESVTYVQPGSSSVVLNRVTGVDPSTIYGHLSGNGQVWVINPNGLLVGSGATIQTGSFLASTMNISNENFMSGNYVFTASPDSFASIINQGAIRAADGGYVVLAAPSVNNAGLIVANLGSVHLASGETVTLGFDAGNLINVAVRGDVAATALGVANSGHITADGGQVVLTARVAGDIMKNVVNNSGVIEAKSIVEKNGYVVLGGGDHGITANSGRLDASGINAGETGGTVTITGDKVGLFSGASVDVSGAAGGGTVLVGGNFHGAGPEKNASMTYVDKDAAIKADALVNGAGGKVVVWSDDATRYYGAISARGAAAGDGGTVEVSGKSFLDYRGSVDLRAPNGRAGTLLLDPDDVLIASGAASLGTNLTCTGGTCDVPSGSGPFFDTTTTPGSPTTITDGTLGAQLALGNVTVTASGAINAASGVAVATNSNTLTLTAGTSITLGGTYAGGGALRLNFGTDLDLRTTAHNVSGVTVTANGGGSGRIIGPNDTAAWSITGANAGSLSSASGAVAFSGIATLAGGSLADTLTGPNSATAWNISGANAVTSNGMSATGMNALVGGSGSDTFTLASGVASFGGTIAGGGGNDTLAATDGINAWQSSGATAGTLNATTSFSGIANLAGGTGTDTLTGQNAANAWSITGANAVTLDGMNATGMEALAGGAGADTFTVAAGIPTFNGSISGGGGTDTLAATDGVNAWTLTGANSGTLNTTTTFSGITTLTGGSGSDTLTGTGQTYTLDGTTVNRGSNGTVNWNSMDNLSDTAAGVFNFGTGGGVTGNISAVGGTLNFGSRATAATVNLAGSAGATTGVGGVWSGIATVIGSTSADTISSTAATYNLTGANAGNSGGVSWTSFENLADSAGGTFKFGAGSSLTGNLAASGGTLDYSAGIAGPVAVNLSGGVGATTAIGGVWSGIATVIGSSGSDTLGGTNKTYTLTGADAGTSGAVSWTSFEKISDAGTGTLSTTGGQTFNLTGVNSGTVTTLLPGGYTGIGTLIDSGAASFRFGGSSVTGNITAVNGKLDYSAGIAGPVAVNLTTKTGSGIGGTWNGISSLTGSGGSDTLGGTNKTYALTGINAGTSSGVIWTSFETIADAGAGTITTTGGQTYNLTGANSGTVTTLLPGGYTGIGTLTDNGTAVFKFGLGSSVTGAITAINGMLDYSAGISGPVTFNLSGSAGATTGIGGTWSGISTVTGSVGSDTVSGTNKTYNLTGANAGTSGGVSWSSFEKIADTGAGTIATTGGKTYNLSGANSGTVTTLLPGGYTGIGTLTDNGAAAFRFGSGGSVTGNISSTGGSLDYSAGISGPVTFNLSGSAGATSGIGGTWNGITTVTGSSTGNDTVSGTNKTYTLTGANAGTSGDVSWSSFEKIADAGAGAISAGGGQTYTLTGANSGTVTTVLAGGFSGIGTLTDTGAAAFRFGGGSLTGSVTATGGTLDYSSGIAGPVAVNLTSKSGSGIGGTWNGIATVIGSNASDTITATGATYNLTGANAGTSGAVSWSSFENLHDTAAGMFRFAAGGSITGNLAAVNGALDYSAGISGPVTLNLSGSGGTTTGIGGTWSGIATVTGSSGSDTVSGTNKTYSLTGANAGTSGAVSWSSFENLADSGAGTFAFGGGSSLSGSLTATGGTLDYSGSTGAATVNLTSKTGSGIGGTWNGIGAVIGSGSSDTLGGANRTYSLTGANAGTSGGVSWSSFETIADTGTGGIATSGGQTYNLTGANSGTVTTLLPGGYTGIGTLTDSGAAVFMFGSGASVTGNISSAGGTLDYSAGISGPVTFNLAGSAGATTGIGGTWNGIATVTGSGSSDTLGGTNRTYTLTGANAGTSGGVSWSSFETIADAGSGTIATTGGQSYHLTGANSGTVTTLLPGGYTGIGNLTDSGAAVFTFGSGGSVTGNIAAVNGVLDYSAGISGPVTFNLSGSVGATTGIGGTWSGIATVTGSGSSDTLSGTSKTYTLTGGNTGTSGGVSWSSFEMITDAGTGTIATTGGQTYNLTGVNAGSVNGLLAGGYTGIGNLVDSGAGTFRFGAGGSVTGSITATGGTLDYSAGIAGPVVVDLAAKTGTGIGTIWSGITTVIGSGASDTMAGSGAVYNLTGTDAGTSGTVSWMSFENLRDATAGIFNMGSSLAITGNLDGGQNGTLNYDGYATPVTVDLAAKTGTGIGGTWSGITTITGSAASADVISGSNQTFNLTGLNAGNNGVVSWISFENMRATAGSNSYIGSGGSLAGAINDAGSAATVQGIIKTGGAQTYNGAVTLGGTTTLMSTGSGDISFAGTVDSGATAHDLTVSTSGITTFGGAVGTTPLNSLTVSGGGATALNGGSVTTNGSIGQVYSGAVVLGADTVLNSGSGPITVAGTLDGTHALGLTAGAGNIAISGAAGGTAALGAVTITSAHNVTLSAVKAAGLIQSAGSGATTLNGAVDAAPGSDIRITTGGTITTNGALATSGNGRVVLAAGGDVAVNSSVTSSGPITLSAGGAISEGSVASLVTAGLLTTQSGRGQTLVGNGTNAVAAFNATNSTSGDIALTNNAALLTLTGINQAGGGLTLANSGEITGSGPVAVAGATTLTAVGRSITLTNAANDFGGTVTVTGAATSITDSNNLAVLLNTTGPAILSAGADMSVAGISTDSISATAAGQVTLSNPTAQALKVTAATIAGTMHNHTPLDLTTTASRTPITVNLTGSVPFLTLIGDVKANIRSLGLYNGVVVMGTEMDHFKSILDLRTAATALVGNSNRSLFAGVPGRSDEFFTLASKSLIDSEGAFIAPEAEPTLVDR